MNRIIVNWMYPRSLTTVFMRAITNRGDFHTIFEPLCLYTGATETSPACSRIRTMRLARGL